MEFYDCKKNADEWDKLVPPDPHFSSAYYRAWRQEGTLAEHAGFIKPFSFQGDDWIGNAYNYGGVTNAMNATKASRHEFDMNFEAWRLTSGLRERGTVLPHVSVMFPNVSHARLTAKRVVHLILVGKYNFRSSVRYDIKKAEKEGVITEAVDPTPKNAAIFQQLYEDNMTALGAEKHWHYYDGFFYEVLKEMGINRSALFLTELAGKVEAGCLIIFNQHVAYYHWAAKRDPRPSIAFDKYQIQTVANWARWRKILTLELGGGRTDRDDDPLLRFKQGFSDQSSVALKYILDP